MVRRKSHDPTFALRYGVHRDPGAAVQNIHFPSHFTHPHFLANILPGYRVAALLPVNIRTTRHLPQFAIEVEIARATDDGRQAELLYIRTHGHSFSRGPCTRWWATPAIHSRS